MAPYGGAWQSGVGIPYGSAEDIPFLAPENKGLIKGSNFAKTSGAGAAYVAARNQIISSINSDLLKLIQALPEDLASVVEKKLAAQNWAVQIAGYWSGTEVEAGVNYAIEQTVNAYNKIITSVIDLNNARLQEFLALQEEKIQLQSMIGASWDQFVMGLKTGDLAPVQSMETFSFYYNQLMEKVKANPKDMNAINQLMQYTSGTYLPFTKAYTEGGGDYASIFNQMVSSSGELYNTVFSSIETINKQFEYLFDYIKELLTNPIKVTVNLNGNEIANAVAVAVEKGTVNWEGTYTPPPGWTPSWNELGGGP
jgi:hypothetical protein